MKFKTKESAIEAQIRSYLGLKNIFYFKVKTMGTFDQAKGIYRKHAGYMKGVSDILGIFNHRFLAIEVKSETGKLSEHQKIFLTRVRQEGGIAFVARSVEEVDEKLSRWKMFSGQGGFVNEYDGYLTERLSADIIEELRKAIATTKKMIWVPQEQWNDMVVEKEILKRRVYSLEMELQRRQDT